MASKDLETRRRHNRESYYRNKEKRVLEVIAYQKANPEKYRSWQRKSRLKTAKEFEEWKSTLKCSNCQESHVSCLEFHHTDPSQKEGLISKLKYSKKRLEKELQKCIVLCSNCHRKLHWEENKTKKDVPRQEEGVNKQ